MKIYSMTATFGKLEHETLTLQPGLNIIEAPNEWGKSTWCAFIIAMLYGVETRIHSTKTALADKERYAPWSGAPMSGRMDVCWDGREITIERRSKGRMIFSDFRAYETASGLPVPELTAANCGQQLLGVERSVFQRSAFLRLNDLPVTQDEALRRRLNALVTTGDESGAADQLAQKLKDLKNRCRFNRTGLLPQAEAEKAALEEKLRTISALQSQYISTQQQLEAAEAFTARLENHRDALAYEAACQDAARLENAKAAQRSAHTKLVTAGEAAKSLPDAQEAAEKIQKLQLLQSRFAALSQEAQRLIRPRIEVPSVFDGISPDAAYDHARRDAAQWSKAKSPWLAVLLAVIGVLLGGAGGFCLYAGYRIAAVAAFALSAAALIGALICLLRQRRRAKAIEKKYGSGNPSVWLALARQYADDARLRAAYNSSTASLQTRMDAISREIEECTGDTSLPQALEYWQQVAAAHRAYQDARQEYAQAESYRAAIKAMVRPAQPPKLTDPLTYSEEETARLLSDYALRHRQLQLKLGQYMGQLEQLGSQAQLETRLAALNGRIGQLEDTYAALNLALQTLTDARQQLQRRFAPRIVKRAQQLFGKLTAQRYDRLTLGEDMQLHAGAQDEDTLHSSLWRSEGTADQLYLALRLAVAGELTPAAPLVLDDALVRFDDARLAAAMEILKEEAVTRQVILFTCQSREKQFLP